MEKAPGRIRELEAEVERLQELLERAFEREAQAQRSINEKVLENERLRGAGVPAATMHELASSLVQEGR